MDRHVTVLIAASLIFFGLMSYWGIRSPDSEVMFRTAEALATRGSFALEEELHWKGFGIHQGKDGKLYSLFGPGQAVLAVPLYKFAQLVERTKWYSSFESLVGKSHYLGDGYPAFVERRSPQDLSGHSLRTAVSILNVIIGTLCVVLFYLTVLALADSRQTAFLTAILFAFGSMILPYSGTFFSELLASAFVLLSFYLLISKKAVHYSGGYLRLIAAGMALGLATTAHITALLFAPFICIYAAYRMNGSSLSPSGRLFLKGSAFAAGLCLILSLLAYFNYVRFDSIFETGRMIDTNRTYTYGAFTVPWKGLAKTATGCT